MKVQLTTITPDPEKITVEIARVSSTRKDKTEDPVPLINYLIKNSHWSPFEHAYMTVEIETSRAIGTQILCHRSFTFQEKSQRYMNLSKLTIEEMFEIPEFREKGSTNRQGSLEVFNPNIFITNNVEAFTIEAENALYLHLDASLKFYQGLIQAGVAPECARMILPLCTKTTIYMTGSIRSWIHFLVQRMDLHAQKEIRLIAYEIWSIFKEQFPTISKAMQLDTDNVFYQYENDRGE